LGEWAHGEFCQKFNIVSDKKQINPDSKPAQRGYRPVAQGHRSQSQS